MFVRMCELEQKKIIHFRLCATFFFQNNIMSRVYVCVVCMYEWAMWHASNYGMDTLLTSHMAWIRQVTHEWVMPHMNESCHTWMRHIMCVLFYFPLFCMNVNTSLNIYMFNKEKIYQLHTGNTEKTYIIHRGNTANIHKLHTENTGNIHICRTGNTANIYILYTGNTGNIKRKYIVVCQGVPECMNGCVRGSPFICEMDMCKRVP